MYPVGRYQKRIESVNFNITWQPSATRSFKKLEVSTQKKLSKKINELTTNPRPIGYIKLKGQKNQFRIRHGKYRIIYSVDNHELIIMVLEVGHRREVYRDV